MARALGGERNIGSGAFGGYDTIGTLCAIEETSGRAYVAGVQRWWQGKGVQAKFAGILAQKAQPAAAVLSWEGKPRLVVMRFDDFRQLCALRSDGQGYLVVPLLDKASAAISEARSRL